VRLAVTLFRLASAVLDDGDSVIARIRGGVVAARPLVAGEHDPLGAVFAGMSRASRYSRYLTGLGGLPASMARALADVDGHRHVAWLASVDDEPVGIGRWIRTAPETAELAFEVVDRHHDRGIGTVLVDVLTTVAAVSGIQRLEATVLPTNQPSLRLLERVGLTFHAVDGLLEGSGRLQLLPTPRVDRPAVARIALTAAIHPNEPCEQAAVGAQ
jgi:GNAT superfamily N-acetyltransferase